MKAAISSWLLIRCQQGSIIILFLTREAVYSNVFTESSAELVVWLDLYVWCWEQERRDQNDLKELVIFILGDRGRRVSEHL